MDLDDLPRRQRELVTLTSGFRSALAQLGATLRQRQVEDLELDLEDPTRAEVLLGLSSRAFRLLGSIASNPMLWTHPHADPYLRSIVDVRIVSAWLMLTDDRQLYRSFVEFGQGRLKLQKLHLEQAIDAEGLGGELDELLDEFSRRVNDDILEEFQEIDLGANFAGLSLHKMAERTGLKRLYNLDYQPLSAEAHGQWDSLLEWDLARSDDPLHQGHRLGIFGVPEDPPDVRIVGHGFVLTSESVVAIFGHLGCDVSGDFEACAGGLSTTLAAARQLRNDEVEPTEGSEG